MISVPQWAFLSRKSQICKRVYKLSRKDLPHKSANDSGNDDCAQAAFDHWREACSEKSMTHQQHELSMKHPLTQPPHHPTIQQPDHHPTHSRTTQTLQSPRHTATQIKRVIKLD